jgi:hypothetical protein
MALVLSYSGCAAAKAARASRNDAVFVDLIDWRPVE